jgi:hypothetical protein
LLTTIQDQLHISYALLCNNTHFTIQPNNTHNLLAFYFLFQQIVSKRLKKYFRTGVDESALAIQFFHSDRKVEPWRFDAAENNGLATPLQAANHCEA